MTLGTILNHPEKITKIYHGKDHYCRCGCGGRYFEPGDKGFTRAINTMKKDSFYCFDVRDEHGVMNNWINVPTSDVGDGMCYTIYYEEA